MLAGYKRMASVTTVRRTVFASMSTMDPPADIHDSQMLPLLLDPENEHDYIWDDSRIHPLRDTDKKDWARKQRGLAGPQEPGIQLLSFSPALCPRISDCMSHS